MPDGFLELSAGGILAILIIREVLAFLKARQEDPPDHERILVMLKSVMDQTQQLYDWHDRRDEEGVPVWYVRKSLETALREQSHAMRKLAENIGEQTRVLERLVEKINVPGQ